MSECIKPYSGSEPKKRQVEKMFDSIAHSYDFLNHFLSAGIDIWWRRALVRRLLQGRPGRVLDVATGTADLAIMVAKRSTAQLTGIDISAGMLAKAQDKVDAQKLQQRLRLLRADAEALPFGDAHFDAVMAAFGVRNFENLEAGLREMSRVTKAGGQCFILEFSKPSAFPVKQLYELYFRRVTPLLGRYFSKDKGAYRYLPQSVAAFPHGAALKAIITSCGFSSCVLRPLTFGVVTLYIATK